MNGQTRPYTTPSQVTGFLKEGGVQGKEGLNIASFHLHSPLLSHLQNNCNMAAKALEVG